MHCREHLARAGRHDAWRIVGTERRDACGLDHAGQRAGVVSLTTDDEHDPRIAGAERRGALGKARAVTRIHGEDD